VRRVGIIGAGKVGTCLGHVLKTRGFSISAVADSLGPPAWDRARPFIGDDSIYTEDNRTVVRLSDIIAVTTQDRAIRTVAGEIAVSEDHLGGKLFFHTSGLEPSSVMSELADKGAMIGSLHPLQTFPDIESAIEVLPQTPIFIEGSSDAITLLTEIAKTIGSKVYEIKAEDKRAYHLSAVFVCNLLCALFSTAADIMNRIDIGLEPFLPIIHATMKNIEDKGPLLSLTGPVVRGDDETVRSHLEVMADMDIHRNVYKALSKAALDMAQKRNLLTNSESAKIALLLEQT